MILERQQVTLFMGKKGGNYRELHRRIENSEPAPKFEIIEQPNNWVKEMKKPSGSIKRTVLPKIKDMLGWRVVKVGDILIAKGTDEEATLLENGHVFVDDEEMSMQDWLNNRRFTSMFIHDIKRLRRRIY